MNPIVIGISGQTSIHKTKLVNELAQNLNATSLGWDACDSQTLGTILKVLKDNQPFVNPIPFLRPVGIHILNPTPYIIFDTPLGYLHEQTGRYIDLCIHFETPFPLEKELKLRADFITGGKRSIENQLKEIQQYLFEISMD